METFSDLVSVVVRSYCRSFPIERGKWKLMQLTSGMLRSKLEEGLYVRLLDFTDPVERCTFLGDIAEADELACFRFMLRPDMTVFDVGSNMGLYTLTAGIRVKEVHAFEPTPEVASRLRQHVRHASLNNVHVAQTCISDKTGSMVLYLSEASDQNSGVLKSGKSITVPATSLDQYVRDHSIERVDIIKIDVEGAEPLVLKGAANLLSGPNAPLLLIEFNPKALEAGGSSAEKLETQLTALGYSCKVIARHAGGDYWNTLAYKPHHSLFAVDQLKN